MRKTARCAILLSVVMFLAGGLPAAAGSSYIYKDLHLGTGFFSTYAYGINASGKVVGYARTQLGDRAFLYTPGVGIQDLGALGGISYSWANGLNNTGKVVGRSTTSTSFVDHAFLWNGVSMEDLGTLTGYNSEASAINRSGQVVGGADSDDGRSRAFLYSGGVMQDLTILVLKLPTGEVLLGAGGINDRGQIAANGIDGHAFLLTPVSSLASLDLLLLD
jgi:probable HAF family extracellular repeat protein